jgi:hypothetical protein
MTPTEDRRGGVYGWMVGCIGELRMQLTDAAPGIPACAGVNPASAVQ